MKSQAPKNPASLFITIGVVLVHVVVIGLIVWGCSNSGKNKPSGKDDEIKRAETETAENSASDRSQTPAGGSLAELFANANSGKPAVTKPAAPAAKGLRVRSANPNFGKPLDFTGADHSNMPVKLVPKLAEWKGTGIIVDMDTRKVLWEKDSHKSVPVASMVKIMTMLLVAEEMERNPELTLDTKIPITASAIKSLPERSGLLWLAPGEGFTVRELLLGVAVKSANDAATQLGEKVGGSVESFVARMNARAKELKLADTVFYNPCGLTDKQRRNSKSSAADMVILGERLLEYPFLLEMCSTKQASIRDGKTVFVTTNKLISPHYPGVDGLKTGYIRAAGSCLTFSALRNNRRIVGCVTGFAHARERDYFCRRLIDWAYDPQSINKPRPGNRKAVAGKKTSVKQSNKKSRSK